jgi:hypothetical protein
MATERIVSYVLRDSRITLHYKLSQYDRYLKSLRYRKTYEEYSDFRFFTLLFVTLGEPRRGEPTSQQPQQGRSEGRASLQGPTTVDRSEQLPPQQESVSRPLERRGAVFDCVVPAITNDAIRRHDSLLTGCEFCLLA